MCPLDQEAPGLSVGASLGNGQLTQRFLTGWAAFGEIEDEGADYLPVHAHEGAIDDHHPPLSLMVEPGDRDTATDARRIERLLPATVIFIEFLQDAMPVLDVCGEIAHIGHWSATIPLCVTLTILILFLLALSITFPGHRSSSFLHHAVMSIERMI
jgi:hypothetical protein